MKDLSRQLMVTGGNVTGLTDELEREGLVERVGSPTDRRSWIVRLTDPGRSGFQAMAAEHEQWVLELFAGLDAKAGAAAACPPGRAACAPHPSATTPVSGDNP
jgi:DNA-binding MarR family transcriptional regulator